MNGSSDHKKQQSKLTYTPTMTFDGRPDGIDLDQDVIKARTIDQLKRCILVQTRRLDQLQRQRNVNKGSGGGSGDFRLNPEDFFVYTPVGEPVGTVPVDGSLASSKNAESQRDSLSQAFLRTFIWICNYFLITQINKHIRVSHKENQLEYLLLVLGVLTFASTAIESINGRFMLLGFLIGVNLLVYLSTKQILGDEPLDD